MNVNINLCYGSSRVNIGLLQVLTEQVARSGIIKPLSGRKLGNGRVKILDGTHRLLAAKALGHSTVPVRFIDFGRTEC